MLFCCASFVTDRFHVSELDDGGIRSIGLIAAGSQISFVGFWFMHFPATMPVMQQHEVICLF